MPDKSNTVDRLVKKSIRYLSYRPRSKQEIREYLDRNYSNKDKDAIIDEVILKIEDFNLLNDDLFASQWASSRLNQGKGPVIIRIELKKKGIEGSVITSTLSNIDQAEIESSAAKQLTKYSRKLQGLPLNQQKSKAYRYLYSRGFEAITINPVIDDIVIDAVK